MTRSLMPVVVAGLLALGFHQDLSVGARDTAAAAAKKKHCRIVEMCWIKNGKKHCFKKLVCE